jgi:hypothetical protein
VIRKQIMVSEHDRAFFRRVAETLARVDVSLPPPDLEGVLAALAQLWRTAVALGHRLPDEEAQAEESSSHFALYERFRARE